MGYRKHKFEQEDVDLEKNISNLTPSPIAIVGFSFRFPGEIDSEVALWDALRKKRDLVTEIPVNRWAVKEQQHSKRSEPGRSITFAAGILPHIEEFDADFFGISPREAAVLDPQQRLLLELSWEAMENAGILPSVMAGSNCAVYVGISGFDYCLRQTEDLAVATSHSMTGNTLSIAANRLSYFFDLRGPSLAVDTACSSSLVALHQACNSLRSGEASSALVGGVNLLLHPHPFVGFTKASMLSATGRCKSFDASGDGYVRSEGGAVLLLKPLDKALADGNDIHAVILASGVNADGARKTGITIPSSEGQAELMREVLSRSGLSSKDVDFIEAHGTGTAIGDPVEALSIGTVYGQQRTKPLPIGSIKANMGHLEPASGMAGLIKTVLALKNHALPPALHLQTPNPYIDFQALNLKLVQRYQPLIRKNGKPLIAGVNSFGFGGVNAHVLLSEFISPARQSVSVSFDKRQLPPLFLSARTEVALRATAQHYAALLQNKTEQAFYDIAYAAAFKRERLEKRLGLRCDSVETVAGLLKEYAEGGLPAQITIEDRLSKNTDIAFVYSGNGAQWVGMGRTLLSESPRFTEILSEIDESMRIPAGFSLLAELQADQANTRLDDTAIAQPLLFAVQVAITVLLKEQGIEPVAVTGHSVGEIAAAWAAGALNLNQAIRIVCARSRAQTLTRGKGRMAAVGMSAIAMNELIARLGIVSVEVAGINSPVNVTLSGDLEELVRIQQSVASEGIFFRLLDLDYAFHHQQMEAIAKPLASELAGLTPSETGNTIFVSTVTGDVFGGTELNADYWWRNVREPVQFAKAIGKLVELGCGVFVEISPHAILQRYISECIAEADAEGRVIATLHRNDDGAQRINEAAMRVRLLTARPDYSNYFPYAGKSVRLPNYPWQREQHWHPRTNESACIIDRRRVHPLLGWFLPNSDRVWENTLDPEVLPWLRDHKVGGAIVYPGAAYAEMALVAAREWFGGTHFVVEQLDIISPMVFADEQARTLRFILQSSDGRFQIKSRQRLSDDEWTLHAVGRLLEATSHIPTVAINRPTVVTRHIQRASHYSLAARLSLEYGPAFQGLRQVHVGEDKLEASLELPKSLQLDDYILHPAILDACFQSLVDFFSEQIEKGQGTALLPVKVGKIDLYGKEKIDHFRAHLRQRGTRSVLADFELLDEKDNVVARIANCRFRAAHITQHNQSVISSWQIIPWLKPHPLDGAATDIPSITDILHHAQARLTSLQPGRRAWFTEALPLSEALVLSFSYAAFRQITQKSLSEQQQVLATPYGCWLVDLLSRENLLKQNAGGQWSLVSDTDLPEPEVLWRGLLQDFPAYLPHLLQFGKVARCLPALLSGEINGRNLLNELQHSSVSEELYNDDPTYLGVRLVLETILHQIIDQWPEYRRLRVLEITAGASGLPNVLSMLLPEDHFDYVLALPSEMMRARLQAEYHDKANIVVTAFDSLNWKFITDQCLSNKFDIVIIRHTLHHSSSAQAALVQTRRWLATGGVLLLAEQNPDWSACFLEGIDPNWWREHEASPGVPYPALLPASAWQQIIKEAGFADVVTFTESAAEGYTEGAYLLLAKRPNDNEVILSEPEAASWLLVTDEAAAELAGSLCSHLKSLGQQVTIVNQPNVSQLASNDHVVYMLGWLDTPAMATVTLNRLTQNIQQLINQAKKPHLWLVTAGGTLATGLQTDIEPNPAQYALWGFGRVVMNEYPQFACTLIDLACISEIPDIASRLINELLHPDGTNEIVLSANSRHCLVMREREIKCPLQMLNKQSDERFYLDFHVPGQLKNLVWLSDTERPLGEDEIEVHTQATGLNFRDVMYLMGLLPDEAVENGFAGASLGLEFAGVVSRTGENVKNLHPGDAVMGFGASCFSSHVITRIDAVAPIPEGWSFEAAATVPTVFFTVYYALKQLADLQPGERILIHGAAGGVGIAAVQLARYLGAEIFATAGSDEKRDFVKLLGADHVFDSRSLTFADDIFSVTGGKGVDVVLNSLAGEAMRRSLSVLAPFGRFLELGKRDFFENTSIGLYPFKNNISYFGIDADQLLVTRPQLAARLFREIMTLFREQILTPLPYRRFTTDRIIEAFRTMQQARHIGKVVVSLKDARPILERPAELPKSIQFKQGSTWLITGGLSGLGLKSACWLAEHGVDHLVLVGRRGMDTPGAKEVIDKFAEQGVKVFVKACDITDKAAVVTLIESVRKILPPLKGILHAAAVFDDQLIENLDIQSFQNVMKPKLLGAWHLHQATQNISLEYFVLYSSITTSIGNPGQANYVAANAGLEGLTALRHHMGLPATCIGWGPIGDAGYLTRNEAVKNSLEQRLGKPPLVADEAIQQLNHVLDDKDRFAILANFNWGTLARLLPSATCNRFDLLNRNYQDAAQAGDVLDIRTLIADKPPAEIREIVRNIVIQSVAQILRINPDRIETNRSLHELGMDSLMTVELSLSIEQCCSIQLPAMLLSSSPTVENVSIWITDKLAGSEEVPEKTQSTNLVAGFLHQHGEELTMDEIQTLDEDVHRLAKTGTRMIV